MHCLHACCDVTAPSFGHGTISGPLPPLLLNLQAALQGTITQSVAVVEGPAQPQTKQAPTSGHRQLALWCPFMSVSASDVAVRCPTPLSLAVLAGAGPGSRGEWQPGNTWRED